MRLNRLAILGPAILILLMHPAAWAQDSQKDKSIVVTSSAFKDTATIPRQYTGDGKDLSPPLQWSNLPPETKSLALTCEDPDAPRSTWFHWIIFNIPPTTRQLKEGVAKTAILPDGSAQGSNDFGKVGYNGPSPPPGSVHHYLFKLVSLDTKLDIKPGCDKSDYYKSIKGHTLSSGQLTGQYSR